MTSHDLMYYSLQDIRSVHMRFIDECFRRLGDLTEPTAEGGGTGSSRTNTSRSVNPELRLQAIERLLLLAQRYISVVEVSVREITNLVPRPSSLPLP